MYERINKKLKIYKSISNIVNFTTRLLVVLTLIIFLYLLQNSNNSDILNENFVISNIIEKPKIQIYENNRDIISIVGDKAEVTNNDVKIYNMSIKSDTLESFAKIVDVIDDGDEIVLKNRPVMVFYNLK